jgi:SAM-dependent methyltransferase
MSVETVLKQQLRKLLDRAFRPYVEELYSRLDQRMPADPPAAPPAPVLILHNVLHTSRTLALCEMPPGAHTVLSVGPNGTWYFDWIEESYGAIKRHIAVEAYVPKPEGLPDNVEWVAADIASAEGVPAVSDSSIDLVFSGQNIEHLWPDQMISFLVEANRVLPPGAWLVLDSPNRNFTRQYRWSMAEHTVELTPTEAAQLLELAGFEVTKMRGLWLCRQGEELLPLHPDPSPVAESNMKRMMLSASRPEDSFLWWAEARKVAEPDESAIRLEVLRLFGENWKERINRLVPHDAGYINDAGDGTRAPKGQVGYLAIGPYMPLPPGRYLFGIDVMWSESESPDEPVASVEVVADERCLASAEVRAGPKPDGRTRVTCEVDNEALAFAVHIRVRSTGAASVEVPFELSIDPEPWRTFKP